MREYVIAFMMTQGMFCALPLPCKTWEEKSRNKMLLFLPIVGLEIGLLWFLLNWVLGHFAAPNLIYGILMCAFPYLITGFIHLDGYMDVTDAISSWRNLEEKRKILKDSHVGSFAVIWCVFLILAGFAFFASASESADSRILIMVPVISRCCSAISVWKLKPMSTSQYAGEHQKVPNWHTVVLLTILFICTVSGFLFFGKYGLVLIGSLLGYGLSLIHGYCTLDGMNGDISGYSLTISELFAVAVYALI